MQGQRVNNFRIVRLLGEGSTGAVYEAEHTLIHRQVALKVLKPGLALDPDVVQRLLNEARATSAIRHPHIVEILDVGLMPDGSPYVVMELLQGESLGARLDRVQQLSLPQALDFVQQAAHALEAAHQYGIIHRDLKPDNLFVAIDPRAPEHELIKVLDFGVAKLRPDLAFAPVHTAAGALFGTPTYMAPEQCRGQSDLLDHRADIYALGVILYEMLCGRPPFLAETVGEMILQHMHAPPPPPRSLNPAIPRDIERVIMKALAKQPEQRFRSMEELSAALGRPLSGLNLVVRETPSSAPHPTRASSGPGASARGARPTSPLPQAGAAGAVPHVAREHALRRLAPALLLGLLGALAAAGIALHFRPGHAGTPGQIARPVQRHEELPREIAPAPIEPVPADTRAGAPAAAPAAASDTLPPPQAPAHSLAPRTRTERASARQRAESDEARTPVVQLEPPAGSVAEPAVAPEPDTSEASPASLPPGYLSLDSEPWAEVFLGPRLLGATPLLHVPLPPGKHMLTLKNSEIGRSTSYTVEIKSGSELSRLVGWAQ